MLGHTAARVYVQTQAVCHPHQAVAQASYPIGPPILSVCYTIHIIIQLVLHEINPALCSAYF